LLFVLASLPGAFAQKMSDFTTPLPLPPGHTLILGIAGGWENWRADHNLTRRITLQLRALNLPNVHVETIENHHLGAARELIAKAFPQGLDTASHQRLIIFGHSLGGAATVRLARWCDKRHLPVDLTVQIDSVGIGDVKIPPNVHAAANLYQSNSLLLHGENEIKAKDRRRTTILGNFRYDYPITRFVPTLGAPWYFNLLQHPHIKMEYDPAVWATVETLILGRLAL
jgi:pimeloyl-ACP methyl ester carboxylesterase